MNKLLINEPALLVSASLASKVGLNESIVLQQIHFLSNSLVGIAVEGKRWVTSTPENLQKTYFPFWCINTVVETLWSLKSNGYIVSVIDPTTHFSDKTQLFRVSYEKIDKAELECGGMEWQLDYL